MYITLNSYLKLKHLSLFLSCLQQFVKINLYMAILLFIDTFCFTNKTGPISYKKIITDCQMNEMNNPVEAIAQRRDRFTALSCIRFMIIFELIVKMIQVISVATVLILKRNETCKQPLKVFLGVFLGITIIRSIIFLSKNSAFFNIENIPEFRDNPDLALFGNFIEALVLFWYIIGFHWLQECSNCYITNPILYYMTALFVTIGVSMYVLPLLAIIALLLLKECIKPKLRVLKFSNQGDLPDETTTCTICFEQYEIGNLIKFLPCFHHFHCDCVDEWLALKESCPLCKRSTGFFNELLNEQYDEN